MKIISASSLNHSLKNDIIRLWNKEYPSRITFKNEDEFEIYLNTLIDPIHYFIVENQLVLGWGVTFLREGEFWFVLILDSKIQSKGYGLQLLSEIKKNFKKLNGWVIDHDNDYKQDGIIYKSPLLFYLKNGFQLVSDCRIDNEKISAVKIKWEMPIEI